MTSNQDKTHGNRKFYDIPSGVFSTHDMSTSTVAAEHQHHDQQHDQQHDQPSQLMKYIDNNIIGRDKVFSGPFGLRQAIYCDYTASGRSLSFIEDYITQHVLPDYGNTHTTTSVTSLQTTLFRHEARDIIRNAVKAGEHDVVLFTGSGCTGAVHKLIHALKLTQPPVVFVGPYEHHSTILPWREIGSEVVRIRETGEGLVDRHHLLQQLQHHRGGSRQLIGCFSAASNVTGILVDVDDITTCLHQHGALAFWDYATAAPYVTINMNPVSQSADPSLTHKDAIFISPHKFVGGVQSPGVLVAKKKLFVNAVPSGCGGGSVFYVRRDSHRYLQEVEMREEGGTPSIVESIRAGLVFQLKEAITAPAIMSVEDVWCRKALSAWRDSPGVVMLGSTAAARLPIFSFLILHPTSHSFLHHNFVCALLNDLFGIQARGGCACAGPYAQDLLGISESLAAEYEDLLLEDSRLDRTHLRRYREYSEKEVLRPGFVRLNLAYFMDEETVDFIIEAVKLVAEHGWKMLPQYKMNPETGEWRHYDHQVFHDRKWLGYVTYKSGCMNIRPPSYTNKGPLPADKQRCLQIGKEIMIRGQKVKLGDQTHLFTERAHELRWFLLPSEAMDYLSGKTPPITNAARQPFSPPSYPTRPYEPEVICSEANTATDVDGSADQADVEECFEEGMIENLTSGYNLNSTPQPSPPTIDMKPTYHREQLTPVLLHTNSAVAPGYDSMSASCKLNRPVLPQASPVDRDDEAGVQPQDQTESHSGVAVTNHSGSSKGDAPPGGENHLAQPLQPKPETTDEKDVKDDESALSPTSKSNQICPSGTCLIQRRETGGVEKPPAAHHRWHTPPKVIFKPTTQACEEFDMIGDGDRVLVCLSGGKDSLSLLHILHQYQYFTASKGVRFKLGAVTIDPQTSSYDPSPLKPYLAALNVPYFYEEQCILDSAAELPYEVASICSYCSRMKRGRLYAAARREGYNVLAMGQHLDDLAESFLMSIFHNGLLRTMKAHYTVQEGDLRVIRPLVYVREKDLRQFAESKCLPIIAENCPACFEAPKERHRMKQLLAAQEVLHPRLFSSLHAAIHPILAISRTGVSASTLLQTALHNLNVPEDKVNDMTDPGVNNGEIDEEFI